MYSKVIISNPGSSPPPDRLNPHILLPVVLPEEVWLANERARHVRSVGGGRVLEDDRRDETEGHVDGGGVVGVGL